MLKTSLAGLRAHKLRLLLTAVAITLGVGFIAGTFVLTDTMQAGVDEKFAGSAGKVDAAVLPKDATPGRPGKDARVPVGVLDQIRRMPGVAAAHGMVRGTAPLIGKDGRAYGDAATIGVSVTGGPLQRYDFTRGRPPAAAGEAVLDKRTAKRAGFAPGDTVKVLDHGGVQRAFTLVGVADFGIDQDVAFQGGVGFDPATAARMTGATGFAEIDVAAKGDAAGLRERLAATGSYKVLTGTELGEQLARSAGADTKIIRLGLLIFGVVSMLVSALVIYNTFAILIAQRMREMALLRCVGATRRQVFGGVLIESAVVGLVGSVIGLLAGVGLGGLLVALLGGPDAEIPTGEVTFAPRTVLVALLVGVVVTVLSAVLPARAATKVPPVAALRTEPEPGTARFRLGRPRAALAIVPGGLGLALGLFGSFIMPKGEAAVLVACVAGALIFLAVIALMPALIRPLGRLAGGLPARLGGVPGRLALENSRRAPRRTATTTIALTIGVGLMSLFAVVGASTRATVENQLDSQFPVDYVLTTQAESEQRIPTQVADGLRGVPQLGSVTELRTKDDIRMGRVKDTVGAVTQSALAAGSIKPKVKSGSLDALRPGTIAVHERAGHAAALGDGAAAGATIRFQTPRGPASAKVVAVLTGESPLPTYLVPESDFARYFGARGPETIFVNAKEGADLDAARTAIENVTKPYPTVKMSSAADLKSQLNESLNMMFLIFGGLLGLAIIIALFGIANTLSLSVVERTRESALLRALGITRGQLRRMLSLEAMIMAVIGAGTGVVLGVALGWAVTRSLAESAIFAMPYLQVVAFVVVAGLAGVLAAVLPARRAARTSVVESLAHD